MNEVIEQLQAALGADEVVLGEDIPRHHYGDWHMKAGEGVRPLALIRPRSTAEVSAALRICHRSMTPVVPQGGLTGLAGGATASHGAVLLSLERMRAIEALDSIASTITVEAGVPLQSIQEAADEADLLFPLDIGSRGSCLIGGHVSTNAGGNRVLRYGMARELVLGMEAVLADGTVITSLNKMLKNNTAYDLKQLFIGSEGTLGIITRLVLRLFPKPRSVATALCAFDTFDAVYDFLKRVRTGLASELSSFEVMWPRFFNEALAYGGGRAPFACEHAAYALVEMMGAEPEHDQARFERVIGGAIEAGEVVDAVMAQTLAEAQRLWAIRDMSGELIQKLAPLANFDVSVETGKVAAFLQDCENRCLDRWPSAKLYNFGHLADSNAHIFVTVDERPFPEHAIDELIYGCVRDWEGSISAEHGIGLLKKEFLGLSRTEAEIDLMKALKTAMDPHSILNPGKLFD